MHRLLIIMRWWFLGCSSAPEKLIPRLSVLQKVELDVVESTSLGGGDQTGLSSD